MPWDAKLILWTYCWAWSVLIESVVRSYRRRVREERDALPQSSKR